MDWFTFVLNITCLIGLVGFFLGMIIVSPWQVQVIMACTTLAWYALRRYLIAKGYIPTKKG